MNFSSVCVRECVYENRLSAHNLNLGSHERSFDLATSDDCCVYVCVVVYECMECKEETRNSVHIYTPTYTRKVTFHGKKRRSRGTKRTNGENGQGNSCRTGK